MVPEDRWAMYFTFSKDGGFRGGAGYVFPVS